MQVTLTTRPHSLEFGIYRDGDNNLDTSQSNVLTQAHDVSLADRSIEFTVENTTSRDSSDTYLLDGGVKREIDLRPANDMSDPQTLAAFVARTLDNAEASGAKQTWIDLVDHGAGDGGGLEADTYGGVMPMQSIADAIMAGEKLHAQRHPEDAARAVDGVVANQCLMSTLGFADALSHAGVKYLAASPETMLSPGVPTTVAEAIASHGDDANSMADAVVSDVMQTRYVVPGAPAFGPAAAFDVLDLSKTKIAAMEHAVRRFDDDAALAAKEPGARDALRRDIGSVDGMVRFPDATPDMPWHSDRPAIAMYDAIANDSKLDASLRKDAASAANSVRALILAHAESARFEPFDGASYRDAVGPTVHAPIAKKQIDPWAPAISETRNAFYASTDEARLTRALA